MTVDLVTRDRDWNFRKAFDEVLSARGARVMMLAYRSPNQNGYIACCTSFERLDATLGNRRRSDSFRPWLLVGAA